MAGIPEKTDEIAAILEKSGRGELLKIQCSVCGLKMDLTELPPFEVVACPGCGSEMRRPAYFGDFLLKEKTEQRDPLTSVYQAYDLKLERYVCVKILEPRYASIQAVREQYLEIARRLASLNHPSIIPIYTCGELNGLFFIVSRLTEHGTLEAYLEEHPEECSGEQVLTWMQQLVSALEKAMESGLFHGILNPAHLLVDSENCLKVSGFGFSGLYASAGLDVTDSCSAPEQVKDFRSDIFSAGVLFFRLLTGRLPREGERDVSPFRKGLDRRMTEIIREMLNPNPAERPGASGVLSVLARIEAEFKFREKQKRRTQKYEAELAKSRAGKKRSGRIIGIVVFLALLGGIAVWFLLLRK